MTEIEQMLRVCHCKFRKTHATCCFKCFGVRAGGAGGADEGCVCWRECGEGEEAGGCEGRLRALPEMEGCGGGGRAEGGGGRQPASF